MGNARSQPGSKQRKRIKQQEVSTRYQLANLRKAINDPVCSEEEALTWLTRVLTLSTLSDAYLQRSVAKLLVTISVEDIQFEEPDAFCLAAAGWVVNRDFSSQRKLRYSPQEILALIVLYMNRAPKSHLLKDAFEEANQKTKKNHCCGFGHREFTATDALLALRKGILQSDLENSLYWLAVFMAVVTTSKYGATFSATATVLCCSGPRLRRKNRMHLHILKGVAFLRCICYDFIDCRDALDVADAAFSVVDFVPTQFESADLDVLKYVLALLVVAMVRAPKQDIIEDRMDRIVSVKRRLEGSRMSLERKKSTESRQSKDKGDRRRSTKEINRTEGGQQSRLNNGEDTSIFDFTRTRDWSRRREGNTLNVESLLQSGSRTSQLQTNLHRAIEEEIGVIESVSEQHPTILANQNKHHLPDKELQVNLNKKKSEEVGVIKSVVERYPTPLMNKNPLHPSDEETYKE